MPRSVRSKEERRKEKRSESLRGGEAKRSDSLVGATEISEKLEECCRLQQKSISGEELLPKRKR